MNHHITFSEQRLAVFAKPVNLYVKQDVCKKVFSSASQVCLPVK